MPGSNEHWKFSRKHLYIAPTVLSGAHTDLATGTVPIFTEQPLVLDPTTVQFRLPAYIHAYELVEIFPF